MADGVAAGAGVGDGAATGPLRLPDWANADVLKMRMRINAVLKLISAGFYLLRPSLFWAGTSRTVQGGNLLTDDRILRSFVYVDLGPMSVVLRHISIGKDCFDRTFRHARIAIDAGVGVDVKTIRQFMKCFNRANSCAVGVLAIDA